MNHVTGLVCAFAVGLALLFGGAPPAGAADGRVPMPELTKAQGEACVESTDVIRRDHMDLLKGQRDQTMRLGIRDGKHSLKGCIECHAAPDPKAEGARTIEGFCTQCHDYVGVKPDCWSCHTPKAEGKGSP
jgi:hypothetical protein